jgi:hypothetical protein
LKRGEIRRDLRKWEASATLYGLLLTMFWSPQSLLITQSHAKVGNGLSDDDEEPYLKVLGAWYWPTSEGQTKEDALGRVRKYHERCDTEVADVLKEDDRSMFAEGENPTLSDFNKWTFLLCGLDLAKVCGVNKNEFDRALENSSTNGTVYRGNGWMDDNIKVLGKEDIKKMMRNVQESSSPSTEPAVYESLNEVDDAMLVYENQDPEFDYSQIEFSQDQVSDTLSSNNNGADDDDNDDDDFFGDFFADGEVMSMDMESENVSSSSRANVNSNSSSSSNSNSNSNSRDNDNTNSSAVVCSGTLRGFDMLMNASSSSSSSRSRPRTQAQFSKKSKNSKVTIDLTEDSD